MLFDVVFEGGGAKGIALSGALQGLSDAGHETRRLVGTSAGAITATNVAIGYTARDILEGSTRKTADDKSIYTTFSDPPGAFSDDVLLDSGLGKLFSRLEIPGMSHLGGDHVATTMLRASMRIPGLRSVFSLLELGGLHAGDAFVRWMTDCLDADGRGLGQATFAEVHEHTGRDLSVIATDTTAREMLVLNHRTAPRCPVAWGVRMSMSIPFFWNEVRWRQAWGPYQGRDITGHAIVDGGVVSNFPLHLVADPHDDEVESVMGPAPGEAARPLGLLLDADLPVEGAPPPAPSTRAHSRLHDRIDALVDTMMSASDNAVIEGHRPFVCRLPVAGYGTTEFDLSDDRVEALYSSATAAMRRYLQQAGIQGATE